MTANISKFTIRVKEGILKKFRYVAAYNGRSANKELECLMAKHVAKFEKEYGTIEFEHETAGK